MSKLISEEEKYKGPIFNVTQKIYLREDGTLCPLSEIAQFLDDGKIKVTKMLSIFHYFALLIPKKEC